jgi:phosphoglucosamine mutase
MDKLFGTDGIRGKANVYPMTPEFALQAGRAIASCFGKSTSPLNVVVGKDTRLSGDMLENALCAGLCCMGADVTCVGIMPTPGIAQLTADLGADAGIVISASHNPFEDNGIKLFNADGFKLSDSKESEIEQMIHSADLPSLQVASHAIGRIHRLMDAEERYVQFLKYCATDAAVLRSIKVIVDCANGATYRIAPLIFKVLGIETVKFIFNTPDGKNINAQCGSQHPQALARTVVAEKADLGLAFDGDGDRLIAVAEDGTILTGDQVLVICANYLKNIKALKDEPVVSTVMSNMGLGLALKKLGLNHRLTGVGDRYVMQEMLACGSVLGGEDSGHMIFLNYHTTGDGLLAALKLMEALAATRKPLSRLSEMMTVLPQVLMNVEVKQKPDLNQMPEIMAIISSVEKRLGAYGRVLVRYSGTQPQCRIMVEGPSKEESRAYCSEIAEAVRRSIGS